MHDHDEELSVCPWCGLTGYGFEESDPPADYCGHDPALIRESTIPVTTLTREK